MAVKDTEDDDGMSAVEVPLLEMLVDEDVVIVYIGDDMVAENIDEEETGETAEVETLIVDTEVIETVSVVVRLEAG